MLDIFKKFLGSKSARDIKLINPLVDVAVELAPAIAELSNDQLRAKTIEFKQRIKDRIIENHQ